VTGLFPRFVHRLALSAASFVIGIISLIGLTVVVALAANDPELTVVIDDTTVPPGTHPPALMIALAGEAAVGLILLAAAVLLVLARDRAGTAVLRAGLVFGVAAVNIVLGYVSAEAVVIIVLIELAGLAEGVTVSSPCVSDSRPGSCTSIGPRVLFRRCSGRAAP